MPQGEETFLYRIVTQLDDEQAFSQVSQELSLIADKTEQAGGKIQNLTSELAKMLPKSNLGAVQEKLQQISGPTDIKELKIIREDLARLQQKAKDGTAASKRLAKVLDGIDSADFKALSKHVSALQDEINDTSPLLLKIQKHIDRLAQAEGVEESEEAFQDLRTAILQNEDAIQNMKGEANFDAMTQRVARLEDTFQDTRNSVAMAGGSIEKKLGQSLQGVNTQVDSTRLKTNQMSQAILQGAQDAQFGVIGVANNIQMLGESVSRQMNKGTSATRLLKSALSNLFMGPMAIGTLITILSLIAQNWDAVKSASITALNAMGAGIEEANIKLDKLAEKAKDVSVGLSEEEFLDAFKKIENEALLKTLENRFTEVNKKVAVFQSEMNRRDYYFVDFLVEAIEKLGMVSGRQKAAAWAAGMNAEKVLALKNAQQSLKTALEKANAESIKELETRREVRDLLGDNATQKQINEITKALLEEKKARESLNKELGKSNFLRELEEKAMLARKEGREKRLAEIDLEYEKMRDKVRENTKKNSAARIRAMGQISKLEENAREEFFEKQAKEEKKAREQARKEAQKTQNKIKQLRAEILPGLAGKFATIQADLSQQLSETSNPILESLLRQRAKGRRTKAIQGWWKSTMEEFVQQGQAMKFDLGPGFQDVFLPFGGNKGKVKEKAKDQMQIAQEAFRAEQERLRGQQELLNQRSELGPQESSLFGLDVAQMENKADERLQFQKRIARREKNIQEQRLQNQQELLKAKLKNGEISKQKFKRQADNVQKQITMTEQQWYRKRENLQDQHVKKKIKRASQFGQEFLGQTSSFASTWFNTWKNEREQELKEQGKTEEERRKILKEEGQKRFQFMKNVKIAEASADTIAGVAKTIGNYAFPYWIPLAAAHAAAGAARVNKIAQLSIGDKIGGGGGAGAGGSASSLKGEFTQLTPDRNARRANNLANASRRSQATQRRSEADKMQRAAQKMDNAARKIQKTEVTYDDKTAEDITERGRSRQESLNI